MADLKLDINISKKQVTELTKQVIREKVEEQIDEALKMIDIDKVITDKINNLDTKLSKKVNDITYRLVDGMKYEVLNNMKGEIRKIVLEEIQKKPLSGNVYLRVGEYETGTDYDY